MTSENIKIRIENECLFLEFFSEKANSLSTDLIKSFNNNLKEIENNLSHKVKAVIISSRESSAGSKIFCSGADLIEYKKLSTKEEISNYLFSIGELFSNIMYLPLPVIAVVEGKSVGGGLGLIASCDYSIATNSSSVRLSELSLGIAPLVISPFLTFKIGNSHFNSLIYSTEWKDSDWGLRTGLFSEVLNQVEMTNRIITLTEKFKLSSIITVKTLKQELLPDKKIFLEKLRYYSDLNSNFVFSAREKGLL